MHPYIVSVNIFVLIQETPMGKNTSVSEVSGGAWWAYSGHALKYLYYFNTDYTTMVVAMEASHTFAENYHLWRTTKNVWGLCTNIFIKLGLVPHDGNHITIYLARCSWYICPINNTQQHSITTDSSFISFDLIKISLHILEVNIAGVSIIGDFSNLIYVILWDCVLLSSSQYHSLVLRWWLGLLRRRWRIASDGETVICRVIGRINAHVFGNVDTNIHTLLSNREKYGAPKTTW